MQFLKKELEFKLTTEEILIECLKALKCYNEKKGLVFYSRLLAQSYRMLTSLDCFEDKFFFKLQKKIKLKDDFSEKEAIMSIMEARKEYIARIANKY